MPQNDLEWPISPDSQLFQSFSTEVAQDNSEFPISPDSQLFQSFLTEVAQNDLEWPILHGKKKKKKTMIQGNFYERLHFYADSCAINPTASLLAQLSSCVITITFCKPYIFTDLLHVPTMPPLQKKKSGWIKIADHRLVMYAPTLEK